MTQRFDFMTSQIWTSVPPQASRTTGSDGQSSPSGMTQCAFKMEWSSAVSFARQEGLLEPRLAKRVQEYQAMPAPNQLALLLLELQHCNCWNAEHSARTQKTTQASCWDVGSWYDINFLCFQTVISCFQTMKASTVGFLVGMDTQHLEFYSGYDKDTI